MVDVGGPQLPLKIHVNKGSAKTSFLVSSSLLALRSSRRFFGTPSVNLSATRRRAGNMLVKCLAWCSRAWLLQFWGRIPQKEAEPSKRWAVLKTAFQIQSMIFYLPKPFWHLEEVTHPACNATTPRSQPLSNVEPPKETLETSYLQWYYGTISWRGMNMHNYRLRSTVCIFFGCENQTAMVNWPIPTWVIGSPEWLPFTCWCPKGMWQWGNGGAFDIHSYFEFSLLIRIKLVNAAQLNDKWRHTYVYIYIHIHYYIILLL